MINITKRPLMEDEKKYTFPQSTPISMQCGLIGHLIADMETYGTVFCSSWFDCRQSLKTAEFKEEFDNIINSLREEGNILQNRKALANYCYSNHNAKISDGSELYGMRIDTEKYAYLFRFNPNSEFLAANIMCYCYLKELLDNNLERATRGIRFITSGYKNLFVLKDGGRIKITFSNGETAERLCRFVDEYHVEIGNQWFHICEFAEKMEQNGNHVEPFKEDVK